MPAAASRALSRRWPFIEPEWSMTIARLSGSKLLRASSEVGSSSLRTSTNSKVSARESASSLAWPSRPSTISVLPVTNVDLSTSLGGSISSDLSSSLSSVLPLPAILGWVRDETEYGSVVDQTTSDVTLMDRAARVATAAMRKVGTRFADGSNGQQTDQPGHEPGVERERDDDGGGELGRDLAWRDGPLDDRDGVEALGRQRLAAARWRRRTRARARADSRGVVERASVRAFVGGRAPRVGLV